MPYSPEIPPHFYRFSCRLFRPSGNFPPNSSPEALRPCLPSIINKDNSPVIRRTADRQQRKSSQLHTRKKMPLSSIPDNGIFFYKKTIYSLIKRPDSPVFQRLFRISVHIPVITAFSIHILSVLYSDTLKCSTICMY